MFNHVNAYKKKERYDFYSRELYEGELKMESVPVRISGRSADSPYILI